MSALRGVLGLAVLVGVAVLFSKHRRGIPWRTVGTAFGVQVLLAVLVLRTPPGQAALRFLADQVETLIGYTDSGTSFVFGSLFPAPDSTASVFALQVLPVIIFLGALVYLLYFLRVIQYVTWAVGGAISWLLRVSNLEGMYAATVIFLGQSEAPLMIAPYLQRLTRAQVFTVATAGFAAAAGSTLVGYALLGAPLPYLLAATAMNAPASLLMAKIMWPDSTPDPDPIHVGDAGADGDVQDADVRQTRDTESVNAIHALSRGTLAGGQIAVTVGALLIAFVALIALGNGIVGGIGGWFGVQDLTVESILGSVLSPLAWLLGVPWSEATLAGSFIGEKTILNEFVAFASFGPQVDTLSPVTVVVVTFALAGFANFSSIAIQIGTLGSLRPELRAVVAKVGLRALLAGALANLANAAVAGVVFSI